MAISYYKDIYNLLSKKHPNKKIYVISDHHFFHSNIIQYERPRFDDVFHMNEHIIKFHNETVNSEDVVIFLGDFCFKNSAIKDCCNKMNGHKYLLLGNHDTPELARKYGELGLEGIFTTPVKIHNTYLSHQPLSKNENDNFHFKLLVKNFNTNKNGYNYHGHIHSTKNSIAPFHNVTCEALGYVPLLIGYTGGMLKEDDSPLIIDSEKFQNVLHFLHKEKNINPNLLLTDYIYSMMLESNSAYSGSCFVYGSFPIYKKYGYLSNFSDLDIALIHDNTISKNRNNQRLKEMVDRMYNSIKDIDGVNTSFIKRIVNMCAFEAMYASKNGYYTKCILDANLIPYNLYQNSDFIQSYDCSTIQKLLEKESPELLSNIYLPRYQAQYLTPNGDMANLILQIVFQKGFDDKKNMAFHKLKYIFKNFASSKKNNENVLEDQIIRFFLRNILFFHTLRRANEIEYVQNISFDLNKLFKSLPIDLTLQLEAIFKDPNSDFNVVFNEISKASFEDIPTIVPQLLQIKK